MTLSELLTPAHIIPDMQSELHWPSIEELVEHLVDMDALSTLQQDWALKTLKEREELGTTGIGGGIAIPHAKIPSIDRIIGVFGRSLPGIDYCAQDCAPVHHLVLLLVPEDQHGAHLKTLASVAKTLNSAQTRKQLIEAADAKAIYEILCNR